MMLPFCTFLFCFHLVLYYSKNLYRFVNHSRFCGKCYCFLHFSADRGPVFLCHSGCFFVKPHANEFACFLLPPLWPPFSPVRPKRRSIEILCKPITLAFRRPFWLFFPKRPPFFYLWRSVSASQIEKSENVMPDSKLCKLKQAPVFEEVAIRDAFQRKYFAKYPVHWRPFSQKSRKERPASETAKAPTNVRALKMRKVLGKRPLCEVFGQKRHDETDTGDE